MTTFSGLNEKEVKLSLSIAQKIPEKLPTVSILMVVLIQF